MAAHRRLGLDRDQIRYAMQVHINQRMQAAMVDFGRGWSYPVCREYIAQEINYACSELRRARIGKDLRRRSFPSRHEEYLRLWRVAHDEIITLRRQVADLEPRARAYDNIDRIVGMMPQPPQGYGEDVAWRLKELVEKLVADREAEKDQSHADT